MQSPEPEFFVVFSVPLSEDDGFRVEAVFTKEDDALEHAKLMEMSKNYRYVTRPSKELMGSILDRLLNQKLRCLAVTGAKQITININR